MSYLVPNVLVVGSGGLGNSASWGLVEGFCNSFINSSNEKTKPLEDFLSIDRSSDSVASTVIKSRVASSRVLTKLANHQPPQNIPLRKLSLHLVDFDTIELSNLNRQVLFREDSIGLSKSRELSNFLNKKLTDKITITSYAQKIEVEADLEQFKSVNFVVDGSDNVKTKFLINDWCIKNQKPFCYAGLAGYSAQWIVVTPPADKSHHTPCLRCLYGNFTTNEEKNFTQNCQATGIVGALAGFIGFIQARECLDYFEQACVQHGNYSQGSIRTSLDDIQVSEPEKTSESYQETVTKSVLNRFDMQTMKLSQYSFGISEDCIHNKKSSLQ